MEYYLLLTTATAVIAGLGIALFVRTRDLGIVIGTGALYYWSLFGAWFVVIDKEGGESGKHYHYLESKMFPIELDNDYLLTIALYAAFIILLQLTLLFLLHRSKEHALPRIRLHHERILLLTLAAALGSVFLLRDELSTAWTLHTSAYWYTRRNPSEWFTLHQVLNRAALLPAAIGFALLLTGKQNRYFVNVRGQYTAWGYAVVLGVMGGFTFTLGNKNEVLSALIAGVLAYAHSTPRIRWVRLATAFGIGVWFMFSIDYFRSFAITDLLDALTSESRAQDVGEVARFVTSSNESYAAHFSMYGVLSREVEPQFGYSIYSLACSIVPRILWKDRPDDIYIYYARSVGAVEGQGYSIHHATGWYLNFGYVGVALGAVTMGLAWAFCIRARRRIRPRTGMIFRIFATVAPWFFAACLPPMLRAGPEAYKGLFIEGALIPVTVLIIACQKTSRRPAWTAARLALLDPAPGRIPASSTMATPSEA